MDLGLQDISVVDIMIMNQILPLLRKSILFYQEINRLLWLMISEHEEGYRYILQLGNEGLTILN